jgi:hypothetical protein
MSKSQTVEISNHLSTPCDCSTDESRSDESESSDDHDETNYAELEEMHGRAYVRGMLDPYDPDPKLVAHLNETDTSCSNEDLGRDEDGNRDDD